MPDTDPDSDVVKHQQEADLGHKEDIPVKGGAVEGPIERLDKSVDADGLLHAADESGLPADTEEFREADISRSRRNGPPER